jgi:hypothetical protein
MSERTPYDRLEQPLIIDSMIRSAIEDGRNNWMVIGRRADNGPDAVWPVR